MTSAIRDGRFAALSACSAAAVLAASGAHLFSAAWAAMASDTVPTNATATASERREMPRPERRPNTFITGLTTIHRPQSWRAVFCAVLVAPESYLVCWDAAV